MLYEFNELLTVSNKSIKGLYSDILLKHELKQWFKKCGKDHINSSPPDSIEAICIYGSMTLKIEIPPGIKFFKNLKYLTINGANISKIDHIFNLPLKYLCLTYNNIDDIPREIVKMKTLEIVDLDYNGISKLPRWLKDSNIKELNVDFNRVTKIPSCLKNIKISNKDIWTS
jgi:hypothetical protein